jgi:hypothetical protein
MEDLDAVRASPRHMVRAAWYNGAGPMLVAHFDENEHVGMFGFKILAAVDGWSRYPPST